ncbi:hypothetical protein ASG94_02145 [Nocardioides sp. Soil805]|nr:hypothetical protein ASG94_02145 [Nocardioides sp. Soil805]
MSAGLLVVVALVAGSGGDTRRVTPDAPASGGPRPGAASATLHLLEEAVESHDPDAARDLAPSGDSEAEALLGAVADNAEDLRVNDFSARYVDETGPVADDGSWTAQVALSWAFEGFDREPADAEVVVTFATDGDEVRIRRFGGAGDGIEPLWLQGPLEVRRTDDALVLVSAGRPGAAREAASYARRVGRGTEVVRHVLRDWRPSVVVEVPASAAALDATLDAADGTYAGIAAVTTTVDGSGSPDAPVHVFVNPDVTRGLRGAGAQVVMSHEITHVATDAATSAVDLWLLEGFADYVALRDVPLPLTTTAGRAIDLVRRDGLPRSLPGPAELDTRATDLEAAYELAWLACDTLADELGEPALLDVYRRVSGGVSLQAALRRHGTTSETLVQAWRDRLASLAS